MLTEAVALKSRDSLIFGCEADLVKHAGGITHEVHSTRAIARCVDERPVLLQHLDHLDPVVATRNLNRFSIAVNRHARSVCCEGIGQSA